MIRWGLIALAALAASWLVIAVSGASLMRNSRPDLAMSFWPFDARARASAADRALVEADRQRSAAERARALSIAALQRDVTVASAWRTLALTTRDPASMSRLFHISDSLSRRDLATQLWLIEEQVSRNNIPGALRHYDSALRSTTRSYELLLPILVRATREEGVAAALVPMLRDNPPWRMALLERYSIEATGAEHLIHFVEDMIPTATDRERELITAIMRRLVEQRQFATAEHIYALLSSERGANIYLRNGDFESANQLLPFHWQIDSSGDFGADQRRGDVGQDQALHLYGTGGTGGIVATQLVILRPGDYRLTARLGPPTDARPGTLYWQVSCATETPIALAEADQQLSDNRQVGLAFRVPAANCPAQWVRIGIRADFGAGSVGGWLDDVAIRPVV